MAPPKRGFEEIQSAGGYGSQARRSSALTLDHEMMTKRKKILATVAAIAVILAADGIKSYLVARNYIASRYAAASNVRFQRIYFVGIWQVGFKMDAWHKDAWIQVRVTPLWPGALGHTSCR